MRRYSRHRLELRHRFYEILEQGPIGNWVGRLAGSLIVLLIVINLFAVVLESVPEYEARYAVLFGVIGILSLAVFTSEYLMRIWVAVEHAPMCIRAAGTLESSMSPARSGSWISSPSCRSG